MAPVLRFKTEGQAIERANATEFGLASYFHSRDISRILRVGAALEYGERVVITPLGPRAVPQMATAGCQRCGSSSSIRPAGG